MIRFVLVKDDEELLGMARRARSSSRSCSFRCRTTTSSGHADRGRLRAGRSRGERRLASDAGTPGRDAADRIQDRQGVPADRLLRANNLEPSWVVGSHDIATIYAVAAAGEGVACYRASRRLCLGPGVDVLELVLRPTGEADRSRVVGITRCVGLGGRVRPDCDGRGGAVRACSVVRRELTSC